MMKVKVKSESATGTNPLFPLPLSPLPSDSHLTYCSQYEGY